LIMCTGSAYRPFLHDRHFSARVFQWPKFRAGFH
jgi:hypothetical protein